MPPLCLSTSEPKFKHRECLEFNERNGLPKDSIYGGGRKGAYTAQPVLGCNSMKQQIRRGNIGPALCIETGDVPSVVVPLRSPDHRRCGSVTWTVVPVQKHEVAARSP